LRFALLTCKSYIVVYRFRFGKCAADADVPDLCNLEVAVLAQKSSAPHDALLLVKLASAYFAATIGISDASWS
jgi:hypothetical protein